MFSWENGMNEYMIRSPYTKKSGDKYIKIEIQLYEWKRKIKRTERVSKMHTLRVDLDSCSTLTPKVLYKELKEYLTGRCLLQ